MLDENQINNKHPSSSYPRPLFTTEPSGQQWTYDMRRTAQSILPYLFLGPAEASRNLALLHSNGITAICILRSNAESMYLKPRFPQTFTYQIFDIHDSDEQNLIRIAPSFRQFIDTESSKPNGRILVHDDGGMSRGPAMVILYLIEKYNATYEEAAKYVQDKRYCTYLNSGFVEQCKAYEAICRARQIVSNDQSSMSIDSSTSQRKRELDKDAMMDVEDERPVRKANVMADE